MNPQWLRRIECVHALAFLPCFVSSCFPTFLAESNHQGVVVPFEPLQAAREGVTSKFYCPESVLGESDTVQGLTAALQ